MSKQKKELEMILTGMLILCCNMESYMNEIQIERRKITRLLAKIDERLAEPPIQITYI